MSMKPCPFCGGEDVRWSAEKFRGHRFKCMNCHAVGPFSEPDRGATARETSDIRTEAAAKLWNTRPDYTVIAFLRAEVKAAAERADAAEKQIAIAKADWLDERRRADSLMETLDANQKRFEQFEARADAAEQERDRLRERLAKCHGDLMVADQRIKELEIANDAYAHGPPAESQQLAGALKRIKETTEALEQIAAMDPKRIRADDLGRAARIAYNVLGTKSEPSAILPTPAPWEGAP